ncbi:tetratricopeptide repeat protein [Sporosarcina sp. Te-1]|uniref:tetratricopeptide repeat protein n=1 Tax=Sporosarcina sp. Te-1 TaxID=2818390 RepID=UPI001A9F3780|nr:tetratricopeptide repeat protein [Sporosarcina sp. Te-1]QTD41035.1 tetratricopeptide repeat protein [Sporosarcina sp. Te-1]
MRIGHVIRAERVRQEMKQVVLAKGICTPSYLSKIERNLIEPSEEIVELLMERLGLDSAKFLQPAQDKTEQEFSQMLKDSYRNVITKRDKDYTRQQLELLLQENPIFEDQSIYYTHSLIIIRFRLIAGDDLDDIGKELDNMANFSEYFGSMQTYLFTLNKALFYYTKSHFKKALEHFEQVIFQSENIYLEDWEKAELFYMLGVAYTADVRIFHSIEYIRRALAYFRENFQMKRVLDCYILLGITYKKSEQYQEAYEAYTKALQLCDEFNLDNEKGLIYHNIGTLCAIKGKSEEAIENYIKSLELKESHDSPLITIYCLIIEYSKMNDKKLVDEWTSKGLSLYQELNDETLDSYFHHYRFYRSLHQKGGLSVSVAKETIQYFKDIQDFRHVHKYCTALAEWYYSNRKYKLSSIYFREANRYSYIYKKIDNWEDL